MHIDINIFCWQNGGFYYKMTFSGIDFCACSLQCTGLSLYCFLSPKAHRYVGKQPVQPLGALGEGVCTE